jgi:hypothetical protein
LYYYYYGMEECYEESLTMCKDDCKEACDGEEDEEGCYESCEQTCIEMAFYECMPMQHYYYDPFYYGGHGSMIYYYPYGPPPAAYTCHTFCVRPTETCGPWGLHEVSPPYYSGIFLTEKIIGYYYHYGVTNVAYMGYSGAYYGDAGSMSAYYGAAMGSQGGLGAAPESMASAPMADDEAGWDAVVVGCFDVARINWCSARIENCHLSAVGNMCQLTCGRCGESYYYSTEPTMQTTLATTTSPAFHDVLVGALEFTLSVEEATAVVEAFADPDLRAGVSAAFATGLADAMGVDPSAVVITELLLTSERRLGPKRSEKRRLTNSTGGLTALYEIHVPDGQGDALVATMLEMDDDALSAVTEATTQELQKVSGLETVEIVGLERPEAPAVLSADGAAPKPPPPPPRGEVAVKDSLASQYWLWLPLFIGGTRAC